MTIFKLPDLGEGLPDGTIQEWYVSIGDEVKIDQPLVAIETAKAVVDIPSPIAGIIEKLYGRPGEVIETGQPLIEFRASNAPETKDLGTVVGNIEQSNEILKEPAPEGIISSKKTSSHIKATPAVRALARTLNVDLSTIIPTGLNASITLEDVQKKSKSLTSLSGTKEAKSNLTNVRRMMALTMTKAHKEVVPVTLVDDANISNWNDDADITLKVIHAIFAACKEEPNFNAHFNYANMTLKKLNEINLGIAVDTKEGLYVPVIQRANKKTDAALRQEINQFKHYAKQNKFPSELLHGATISLSNFGIFAGRYANPIVVPPMVAIIGIGKLRNTVIPVNGVPKIQRIMPISITIDHRALTGGEAARFLNVMLEKLKQ